jgi:hypothetical protein
MRVVGAQCLRPSLRRAAANADHLWPPPTPCALQEPGSGQEEQPAGRQQRTHAAVAGTAPLEAPAPCGRRRMCGGGSGAAAARGAACTPAHPSHPLAPASLLQHARCVAETSVRPDAAVKSKPSFDFNQYMMQRAQIIDAALDKSVPMQYPEVINESMRYSLLAGAAEAAWAVWAHASMRMVVVSCLEGVPKRARCAGQLCRNSCAASTAPACPQAQKAPFLLHPICCLTFAPPRPAARPSLRRRQARAAGAVPGGLRADGRHH